MLGFSLPWLIDLLLPSKTGEISNAVVESLPLSQEGRQLRGILDTVPHDLLAGWIEWIVDNGQWKSGDGVQGQDGSRVSDATRLLIEQF